MAVKSEKTYGWEVAANVNEVAVTNFYRSVCKKESLKSSENERFDEWPNKI